MKDLIKLISVFLMVLALSSLPGCATQPLKMELPFKVSQDVATAFAKAFNGR
jgi:hypothetical protein